jgi:ribose-phosphate pyrophosphokinase
MINHELMLFAGNANPDLAPRIAKYLKKQLSPARVGKFPEGEISVQLEEPVRGADVFLIQGTSAPPNQNMMELLVLIDALRRASAGRITAVLPFYGYGRQDRKDKPRVPISAKLVANLITAAGADRLLTVDLHAAQIQGFFDIPVDHLYSAPVFIKYLKNHLTRAQRKNMVVVSPDVGGIKIADRFAQYLNLPLAIVDKRRWGDSNIEVRNVIGEVKGKDVLLIDDLVSTGNSLVSAVERLKEMGASRILAAVTHAVFCAGAVEKINDCSLEKCWVTDTIPLSEAARHSPKIEVLSVAELLGEAIKRIHLNTPVSILFELHE